MKDCIQNPQIGKLPPWYAAGFIWFCENPNNMYGPEGIGVTDGNGASWYCMPEQIYSSTDLGPQAYEVFAENSDDTHKTYAAVFYHDQIINPQNSVVYNATCDLVQYMWDYAINPQYSTYLDSITHPLDMGFILFRADGQRNPQLCYADRVGGGNAPHGLLGYWVADTGWAYSKLIGSGIQFEVLADEENGFVPDPSGRFFSMI